MPHASLSIHGIDFTYPAAPDPVIAGLTASFPAGFTGIVGANGAGKTTLLQLATGLIVPDAGKVELQGDAIYCPQRTDDPPPDLGRVLEDTGAPVHALRHHLGIERDFLDRWPTLSHGERKRAQIGCALWRAPATLALDEPANHLDGAARQQLLEALRGFNGIGLIVSHDRELLDELCTQCLWLGPGGPRVYPGCYSDMQATRRIEETAARRVRNKAIKARNAIRREEATRREQALKAHRSRSKRGIPDKDHSAKAAINGKRVADSKDGQRLRQLQGRVHRAEAAVASASVDKHRRIGIELPGTVCRRDSLLAIPAQDLPLGESRKLSIPGLVMRPADRIALTGSNGTGKSTLLRALQQHLNVELDRVVVMPQEIGAEESAEILSQVKRLRRDVLGHAMNVVSCLGSRPAPLLDSALPSPGEVRKLLLASGMTRRPHLLILDEPTNHLDLPSIEALEAALADCQCGLLMVSHDRRFLERLTTTTWRIEITSSGDSILHTD